MNILAPIKYVFNSVASATKNLLFHKMNLSQNYIKAAVAAETLWNAHKEGKGLDK